MHSAEDKRFFLVEHLLNVGYKYRKALLSEPIVYSS